MKEINEWEKAQWRMQVPKLLDEVLNSNEKMAIFSIPFNIFGKLLGLVADRAIIINDLELNKLMLRLGLYEHSNPDSKDYMGEDKLKKYLETELPKIKNVISIEDLRVDDENVVESILYQNKEKKKLLTISTNIITKEVIHYVLDDEGDESNNFVINSYNNIEDAILAYNDLRA